MSMNLTELGSVISRDFEQREMELNIIRSEISRKLRIDWQELMTLADDDRAKLMDARRQIWEDANSLIDKYWEESKTMMDGLETERVQHGDEIKTWVINMGEDLKGWYEAGGKYLRKRTGR